MALLNNDFKIKNGLTVNTTVSAGGIVEADAFCKHDGTSSEFLKADGSVDSSVYTTCLGDITAVTAEGALSGGGVAGDITIGLDAAAAANFDQSGCAGILCVGDITEVTTGVYLTGGGAIGSVEIGIDSACTAAWDAAVAGGVQTLSAGDGLLDNGTATDPNIAVDSTVVRTIGDQTISGVKEFTSDLCVNGATDTDLVVVDVSADNVGIGTATPGEKLEVVGNVEATEFIGDLRGAVQFKAEAGENIAIGEAVYISGISGATTVVSLADADAVGEYPAFGIASETATSGNPVTIVQFGQLAGLNTDLWGTEGTELYIGTTAGQLVSAAPTGEGASLQKIAKITRADNAAGSITIMGAGRSNAVPNLDTGNIFIGDGSNTSTTASFDACLCATADTRYTQGVTTTGDYLTGGGTTGTFNIGIDSACAAAWDAAAAGGITEVTTTSLLSGGGSSGSVEVGIDSGALTYLDQSACTGLNCIGDVTNVTNTAGLSTSGTSGNICIGLDATTAASLNQAGCLGINCIGTVTPSSTDTFTNKSGSNSQWTNDENYTTCLGTTTPSNSQTFTNKTGSNSQWTNDENYTTCLGDITGVTDTAGLSTSGTSGTICIGIDAATAANFDQSGCAGLGCVGTVTPSSTDTFTNKSGSNSQWTNDENYSTTTGTVTTAGDGLSGTSTTIGLDASTAASLNQAGCLGINCVGTVTTVTGGDGIDSTGGATPSIAVDSTVARTDVAETFTDNVTIQGNLTVDGDLTCINTVIETTSAVSITNHGTGPALDVNQKGSNDIVDFQDDGVSVFYIEDGGNVGIGETNPDSKLTVAGTLSAQSSVTAESFVKRGGTSSQFLKADGTVDSATYTTCIGDITGVTDTAGLSTSGTSGDICIGIDAATAANFDQSGCAGILCIGTVTPSSADTFTNKSGSNSQWTNDENYTTCLGDITGVTDTAGLSTSGTSGTICIGIDATTAANFDQSGCAGLDCIGTTTSSNSQTFTNKSGSNSQWTNDEGYTTNTGTITTAGTLLSGDATTICIDSGALGYLDQSGCAGLLCIGDVTNVTNTAGLSTSGTSGSICIGLDASTAASLNQAGCLGINCIGTVTPSSADTFTNKSGSNSQWTNDENYSTTTGTVTTAGAGLSGTSTTIGLDATTAASLDQSGCAGLLCIGDVTNITNTAGLSTSGTSGNICIGLDATTAASLDQSGCAGILCVGDVEGVTTGVYLTGGGTTGTFEIGIDSACTAAWDSAVAGGITEVTTSSLLSGGGSSGSVEVGIDSDALNYLNQSTCPGICCEGTVTSVGVSDGLETTGGNSPTLGIATACNTKWDQSGCAGILCVGDVTAVTTGVYLTGGGLAGDLEIGIDSACTAAWDSAVAGGITEVTTSSLLSGGGSSGSVEVGINSGALTYLDQSGCAGLLCVGDITQVTATTLLSGTAFAGDAQIGIDSGALAYLDQSGCAGILCTGTTTSSNSQTFTNKSGSNNQWTNDAGYTSNAGTVTTAGTLLSGDGTTIGIDSGSLGYLDQSGCAGLLCIGDVTNITNTAGLSTSGTSGNICIGLDASTAASLDQSGCAGILCVGTVTTVTGGDGISSTGGTTPDIAVDGTVVRTTGAQVVCGVKHFTNNAIFPSLSSTGTIQANCFITGAFMEANVDVDKIHSRGTVLELNSCGCVVESTHPNSTMVFGVAAGNDEAPVVMGAEPICITGNICIGDYITTSDVPGHGKRSTQSYPYGTIIAQAMEEGSGESHAIKAMIRKM